MGSEIVYYTYMEISDQFQITLTSQEYDLIQEVFSFAYSFDFEEHHDEQIFNSTWDKISNADHNIQFEEVNS